MLILAKNRHRGKGTVVLYVFALIPTLDSRIHSREDGFILRCLCTTLLEYPADGLVTLRTDYLMLGERRGQRQQLDRIFQFHCLRVHHATVTVRTPRLRHPSPPVVDSCSGQSFHPPFQIFVRQKQTNVLYRIISERSFRVNTYRKIF